MKLHLNPRTTIHSESPSIPLIKYNDLIVHYAGKYVYITDYKTLRILKKLEFKDVQVMKIHQNQLYVCTSDVNIISLSTYEITYVLRLSKSLINRIEFYNYSVAISKVNNKVLFYDNLELIAELYSESLCDSLFINDYVYGYLDKDNLVAFNRNGSRILKKSVELISKAWAFESLIYSISSDGILKEWINNIEYAKLGKADSVFIKEDYILITNGSEVNEYSFTGSIIESFNLEEKIQEFCFNISEDESEEIIKRLKLADSLENNIEKNGEILRSGLKNNGKLLRSNIEKINNSLENNNNLNENESDNLNTSSNEDELNENNGIYLGENNTGGSNSSFKNNEEQCSDSIFNEENSGDEYKTVDEENSSGEMSESFENSSGECSDSQINFDDTLPFVQYLDNTVIQLNSGDFLIHENFNISKIVSFNDDLTDSV